MLNDKSNITTDVYCSECKFYSSFRRGGGHFDIPDTPERCEHPSNSHQVESVSNGHAKSHSDREKPAYNYTKTVQYSKKPSEINQNNDCTWFKKVRFFHYFAFWGSLLIFIGVGFLVLIKNNQA